MLAIALSPVIWLVILSVVVLGGIAVHRAGKHGFLVVGGIIVLLALTNPSAQAHKDSIQQEVRKTLRHEVDREVNGAGRFASAAWQHFGGDRLVDVLLDVEYQDFLIFSRTTTDGKTVSLGILGNVFVEAPEPRKRR